MPASVRDRFTVDFEYLYFFSKQEKYFFEQQFEPLNSDTLRRSKARHSGPKAEQLAPAGLSNKESVRYVERLRSGEIPQFRNKRCVWQINIKPYREAHFACVSEDTECLTLAGWKKYTELKIGEQIATFDLKSSMLRWERLNDISVYDYNDKLIKLTNPNLGFLFTPNHRMIYKTRNRRKKEWTNLRIKEVSEIKKGDVLPVSAEWEEGSYGMFYAEPTAEMAELLGWICAKGHFRNCSINIYQSMMRNPHKVDIIEHLLQKEKIKYKKRITEGKSGVKKGYKMAVFSISWKDAIEIRKWIPEKRPSYNMLGWSKTQIEKFLNGFIAGDGCTILDDGRKSIVQKDELTTDILMALAFRLGYRVIKSRRKAYEKSPAHYALFLTKHRFSSVRKTNGRGLNIENIAYIGKVWCPQTPSKTFVARRNGRIIITGNTFPPELITTPILAGCPEFICNKCGKARKKVWKREYVGSSVNRGGHIEGNGKNCQGNVYNVPKDVAKKECIGYTDCGCNAGYHSGIVLDPFMGSGTTALVALKLNRKFIGIEINPSYVEMANKRIKPEQEKQLLFNNFDDS